MRTHRVLVVTRDDQRHAGETSVEGSLRNLLQAASSLLVKISQPQDLPVTISGDGGSNDGSDRGHPPVLSDFHHESIEAQIGIGTALTDDGDQSSPTHAPSRTEDRQSSTILSEQVLVEQLR